MNSPEQMLSAVGLESPEDSKKRLEEELSRTKADLEEAKNLLSGMMHGVDYFHRTKGSLNELLKAYSKSREFLSNQQSEE